VQFAFVAGLESNLGKAFRLANGQTYFDDVTVFAAFDQTQCAAVDKAVKRESSSPRSEPNAVAKPCEGKAEA
jgi:hypothetical protein